MCVDVFGLMIKMDISARAAMVYALFDLRQSHTTLYSSALVPVDDQSALLANPQLNADTHTRVSRQHLYCDDTAEITLFVDYLGYTFRRLVPR